MLKLPNLKPRQVVRILQKEGYVQKRQSGSHLHLYHPTKKILVTIPIHNKDLKRKTLHAILKTAQVKY